MGKFKSENGKKYLFRVFNKHGESIEIDVYDLIDALSIGCPSLQQMFKKICFTGSRGKKSIMEDLHGILSCAKRAIELQKTRDNKNTFSESEKMLRSKKPIGKTKNN